MINIATFDYNGGSGSVETIGVNVGSTYGELPTATKSVEINYEPNYSEVTINGTSANLVHNGWYKDKELTEVVTASDIVTEESNHALYAKWSEATVVLPSVSEKDNYTFGGWYLDSAFVNKAGNAGDTFVTTDSVTLYGLWIPDIEVVMLNGNGATENGTDSIEVRNGEALPDIDIPVKEHIIWFDGNDVVDDTNSIIKYDFMGYYGSQIADSVTGSTISGTQYYGSDGKGLINWDSSVTELFAAWQYDSKIVTLPTVSADGYTFLGWYTEASGGELVGQGGSSYTVTSGVRLYAHWEASVITVQFNMNGGEWVGSTNTSLSYDDEGYILNNGSRDFATYSYGDINVDLPDYNDPSNINIRYFGHTASAETAWNTSADGTGTSFSQSGGVKSANLCDASSDDCTVVLYINWAVNRILLRFNMNGGEWAGSTNTALSYNDDGYVTRNDLGLSDTTIIEIYNYGQLNIDLPNYNSTGFINISKTGYGGVSGAEWNTKADGTGTSFSQSGGVNSADLCDASYSDCTVTLYVNWIKQAYTVDLNGNMFSTTSQTVNGVTMTYDATTSNLTFNGTLNSTNTRLKIYPIENLASGQQYKITLTYVSGSYTSGSFVMATDIYKDTSGTALSTRQYTDVGFPTTGSNSNTLTVSAASASEGKAFCHWIWTDGTAVNFSNYVMKVNITKVESKTVYYGDAYGTLSTPYRYGYNFNGWYTAESGGTKITDTTTVSSTSNHTLYAQWTADTTGPTYTSYEYKNVTTSGYDFYLYGVSDPSGVDRVQFPTWTGYNGQDDIQSSWQTNTTAKGTNQGNGTWYFRVNTTDHKGECGTYNTHFYIYDTLGNQTGINGGTANVPCITVNIGVNNSNYGSVNKTTVSVGYGATYSASGATLTFPGGQTVTATAKAATGYNTSFSSWSSASGTITAVATINANFSRSRNFTCASTGGYTNYAGYTWYTNNNDGTWCTLSRNTQSNATGTYDASEDVLNTAFFTSSGVDYNATMLAEKNAGLLAIIGSNGPYYIDTNAGTTTGISGGTAITYWYGSQAVYDYNASSQKYYTCNYQNIFTGSVTDGALSGIDRCTSVSGGSPQYFIGNSVNQIIYVNGNATPAQVTGTYSNYYSLYYSAWDWTSGTSSKVTGALSVINPTAFSNADYTRSTKRFYLYACGGQRHGSAGYRVTASSSTKMAVHNYFTDNSYDRTFSEGLTHDLAGKSNREEGSGDTAGYWYYKNFSDSTCTTFNNYTISDKAGNYIHYRPRIKVKIA